ncbi:MAG: hypothetical protein ACE14L_09550 [Terriglobales bacterium]
MSLGDHDGQVPEYVLSRAVAIKEKLPAANFELDQLRVEKEYDPFLVVSCGRERFYIDVWEEPNFERERL